MCTIFCVVKRKCTGIAFVDSSPIAVCDNLRIRRNKVFKGVAQLGKSSTGWFFGLKLHVVINHLGEILGIKCTPGNRDDRSCVPGLVKRLFGKLFGDKGYLSKPLSDSLKTKGIELITKTRKNMKPIKRSAFDQAVLRKRSLIETVFGQLKNLCQIEHTRHRSPINFLVNLISGIITYCFKKKKPKIAIKYVNVLMKA